MGILNEIIRTIPGLAPEQKTVRPGLDFKAFGLILIKRKINILT
jgi:hypothetical protein